MTHLRVQDFTGKQLTYVADCTYFPRHSEAVWISDVRYTVHENVFDADGNVVTCVVIVPASEIKKRVTKEKKKK